MLDPAPLRALLAKDIVVEVSEMNGRGFARLHETGADAKLKQVDIFDVPENSVLLHLEQYEQPKSLFKGKKGERKRCDYVLVTAIGNRPLLLFIEMKSAKLETSELVRQFKGAECIMDYCDAALTRFHDQDRVLARCAKRFVIFYRPRLSKTRTRPVFPSKDNDSPEKALRYPAPRCPSLHALVAL